VASVNVHRISNYDAFDVSLDLEKKKLVKQFVEKFANELKNYPDDAFFDGDVVLACDDVNSDCEEFDFWCDLVSAYDYGVAQIGIGGNSFSKDFYSSLYTLLSDISDDDFEVAFEASLDSEEGYYQVSLKFAATGGFDVKESAYYEDPDNYESRKTLYSTDES
jgi:hypothetical protein